MTLQTAHSATFRPSSWRVTYRRAGDGMLSRRSFLSLYIEEKLSYWWQTAQSIYTQNNVMADSRGNSARCIHTYNYAVFGRCTWHRMCAISCLLQTYWNARTAPFRAEVLGYQHTRIQTSPHALTSAVWTFIVFPLGSRAVCSNQTVNTYIFATFCKLKSHSRMYLHTDNKCTLTCRW